MKTRQISPAGFQEVDDSAEKTIRCLPQVASETPKADAFTAVAATVRFNVRAILSTPSFFFARPLSL
jgi:hypothetical protein